MPPLPRVGSLEVAEDFEFQRRSWRYQRVGWGLMALALVAALAGVFGRGPLSRTSAAGEGLAVEYERFGRVLAPMQLRVRLHADAPVARGGEVHVWLERAYLERMLLDRVVPEPLRVEAGERQIVFVMGVSPGAKAGAVIFHLQPTQPGVLAARAGSGAGEVGWRQIIWP